MSESITDCWWRGVIFVWHRLVLPFQTCMSNFYAQHSKLQAYYQRYPMSPSKPPWFYPFTVTPVKNTNIYAVKKMKYTSTHCIIILNFFLQSRKPYHSLKVSILLLRPARLKPGNFSKSKPESGPDLTRPEKPEPD